MNSRNHQTRIPLSSDSRADQPSSHYLDSRFVSHADDPPPEAAQAQGEDALVGANFSGGLIGRFGNTPVTFTQ
jgi:hypothetical protein